MIITSHWQSPNVSRVVPSQRRGLSLVTVSRLSGNGRRGVQSGWLGDKLRRRNGCKNDSPFSSPSTTFIPLLSVVFTRISPQSLLLNSHRYLSRFSALKTEMIMEAFPP